MPHAVVTVVVPFDDRNSDAIDAHLKTLGNLAKHPLSDALDRSAFVHFMSLTVVRGSPGRPAHLVLEASADGYPAGVLHRLARVIGTELRKMLDGGGVHVSESELGEFLERHDRQVGQGWFGVPGVVFDGSLGMSVGRIRREAGLASRIQQILDGLPAHGSALATLTRVRAQLFSEAVYKWAFVAEPVPLLADAPGPLKVVVPAVWSVLRTFLWPLVVLPLLALVGKGLWSGLWAGFWWAIVTLGAELVFAVLAGGIAYLGLRHKEKTDVPDDSDPSAQAVGDIMAREDQCMQNHLAAVSPMKSGWLRRLTLRIALWGVGAFAAYHSRPGTLRNIATIHFAHWILLPGTDKLLFFSNYSGSWESYLEDFIVRGHDGLTGVWSNTQGFPRTSNLVTDGARDGDRFKRWARRQQHPTLFWYTAYPNLTTARIRINAAIRDGLVTASTEACAARWLVNFGFAPPRTATLQSDRIPILVFGGIPALHCARSLVLQIPDPPNAARDWLAKIEQQIGYGERTPARSTLVLGLSASGLRKLGLDDQTLSTFPSAFQHGMAAPWRSRALGDVGGNGPDKWAWGGPGKEADAILNVYACDEQTLDREIESPGGQRAQLNRFGIKAIYEIALDKTPPKDTPLREPFGFTDGISQPLVRGARKWVIARNRIHVVEPGEMILGYPDNFDYIPSSPSTAAGRDLGRNGTFLVVRQLEQDTAAFDDFLRKTADALMGDPRVPAGSRQQVSEWIAAKIVGRWRDGTSLVRHPGQAGSITRPGTLPDNDFLFGTEDPNGLRCPFGAHIRRVNPRETFDAGSEEQLKITNRHRIFRVGRRYGPQNGLQHPGLLFMCVNANIERQFEFMQQTYMLGSNFHGLTNEIDSFARRRGASDVLTIPTEHGPLRLRGLGSFITVQGGGYFFLPGRDTVRFLISGS